MSEQTDDSSIDSLSAAELDALMTRLQEAIDYDLALSKSDIQLLIKALITLAAMQEHLSDKDITLHKLRKLVGMVKSSEKLKGLVDGQSSNTDDKKKLPRKKKVKKKKAPPPEKVFHAMEKLTKGTTCPDCGKGKLYKYEPAQLLRITGKTPFTAQLHLSERLRCNACGQFFTADLSADVLADGEPDQKYGYSARSLMALNKYFAGAPFYRQESLQDILGLSISASTIFDQCEYLANDLQPVFEELKKRAADAGHIHIDDTTHRILSQSSIQKKKRGSDKLQTRTGVYASGLIATIDEQDIILFQTNIGYAGEFFDELLEKRTPRQAPPIIMSDALASNAPVIMEVYHAVCNAHARRQFVDVLNQFPEQAGWVLEQYQQIWLHEDKCLEQQMSPAERLDFHQQHSLPVMDAIKSWGQQQFAHETVEENSGLGKAIAYFIRHFDRLSLFCTLKGAKIDNNYMETMLKLIVRNRKNAYFYKTPAGAAISDVITSCIATAMQANINVFDYLNSIQYHRLKVKANPNQWLPWNYNSNLSQSTYTID